MDFLKLPKTKHNRIIIDELKCTNFPGISLKDSQFSVASLQFEDESAAILKIPLSSYSSFSGILPYGHLRIQPDEYNGLITKQIANVANIPCAEYYLVSKINFDYILSPSFLKDGDELILGSSLSPNNEFDVNNIIYNLKTALTLRKFDNAEIIDVIDSFIKQGFINKFIGNLDEQSRNFGIIVNNRHVTLAPLFDVDYTFGVCEDDLGFCRTVGSSTSLSKYIENFKDHPGFIDWVKDFTNNLNVEQLFVDVEKDTGIVAPKFLQDLYTLFINKQLDLTKKTIDTIEKGEYVLE